MVPESEPDPEPEPEPESEPSVSVSDSPPELDEPDSMPPELDEPDASSEPPDDESSVIGAVSVASVSAVVIVVDMVMPVVDVSSAASSPQAERATVSAVAPSTLIRFFFIGLLPQKGRPAIPDSRESPPAGGGGVAKDNQVSSFCPKEHRFEPAAISGCIALT
jgi:hypothetical protein